MLKGKSFGYYLMLLSSTIFIACWDKDKPSNKDSNLNFSQPVFSVKEGEDIWISVALDRSAHDFGVYQINFELDGAEYLVDYTTSKGSGDFFIDIDQGQINSGFRIYAEDNLDIDETRLITATIANADGGVKVGPDNTATIIIEDDESKVVTIDDLRNMHTSGATELIEDDISIRGVVISHIETISGKSLFLQDLTGGIAVEFTEDHEFWQKRFIDISLKGSILSDPDDMLTISNVDIEGTRKLIDEVPLPPEEIITMDELQENDFLAELVTIKDVCILEAGEFENAPGIYTLSDGTTTGGIRIENFQALKVDYLPLGVGDITGIIVPENGSHVIVPQYGRDLFESNSTSIINAGGGILFGPTSTGKSSYDQYYHMGGANLTNDVIITCPDQFKVSLDGDEYFSSLVFDKDEVHSSSGILILIRYEPTSGNGGEIVEQLLHTSKGAFNKVVDLYANELVYQTVIAGTSFEDPSTGAQYVDAQDPASDHDLINNPGESDVNFAGNGNELGFSARYLNTRNDVGLSDGDDIGVTNYVSDVSAFTDGTQGYRTNDIDGRIELIFDPVDLTGYTDPGIRFDFFITESNWDYWTNGDYFQALVEVDNGVLINVFGVGGEAQFWQIQGRWMELAKDLTGYSTAKLIILMESGSEDQSIYLDNIEFYDRAN